MPVNNEVDLEGMRKKSRDSNIELLRILLMLVIVAHHYIVNSGITLSINDFIVTSSGGGYNCIALLYGWGGKAAINCFVLITGYFMCKQEFRWKKLMRLYFEVKFYTIVIYLIFLLTGYEVFSLKECYKTIFNIAYDFGKGFTASFLAFYALIPFVNKLIKALDQKSHRNLIITLLVIFTGFSTFLLNTTFEYISWYVTLYMIAAYIRLYPCKYYDSRKIAFWASVITLTLSALSILFIYFASVKINKVLPYYWFVIDSNKILALATSISIFCFFKNISLGQNMIINKISSATFGVLLTHAHSDTMRRWLWKDVCQNVHHFENDNLSMFLMHAIICTVLVFSICVVIDLIRQLLQKYISGAILWLKKK